MLNLHKSVWVTQGTCNQASGIPSWWTHKIRPMIGTSARRRRWTESTREAIRLLVQFAADVIRRKQHERLALRWHAVFWEYFEDFTKSCQDRKSPQSRKPLWQINLNWWWSAWEKSEFSNVTFLVFRREIVFRDKFVKLAVWFSWFHLC